MAFAKPVTVLLSHSAAEDGAYADYYDLTVQRLLEEREDLETERLSQPKGIIFSEKIKYIFFDTRNTYILEN